MTEPTVDTEHLRATPELEDFGHKYTEEGSGKLGGALLDNYFKAVAALVDETGVSDGRAVELGCGEGFSTQRLRAQLPDGVDLQASEFVPSLVPLAQTRNPGIRIVQESIYDLTYTDNSFDIVFLLEVLEHLDHPAQALHQISRIVKDDGFLVLGVPREPLWCALNMARGKYLRHAGNTPGHLNHWSTFTLKRYLAANCGPVVAVKTPLPWTLTLVRPKR